MDDARLRPRFVIVGLFQACDPGASFSRGSWPAHVTLAGNFVVDAPPRDLAEAVGSLGLSRTAIPIRFGERAAFGPGRDISVRLVTSSVVTALHDRLADVLETQPGFAADEPAYWRSGYRAHLTLTPAVSVARDETRTLRYVVLSELSREEARVVAAWDLGEAGG
ncbi:2'-5' RNA ligase family protein [Clavibacter tessellarius]|uniref:2'-5' RNA ligase family protein n=1 Tax=Clavibacter tessellarius TaxID=31965 RepID=A0A154V2K6_9MICO|nr:2'-5' RNA ligase family protein [Clavibacter michiganensis]KZC95414.1 hypothetical protein AWH51_08265 [Clavibacter michiganensis subsp. tessellarius]